MPDFSDVLAQLSLDSPPGTLYNVMLYSLLLLNIVAMLMQSDKQLFTTLLLGSTALLIAVAKLNIIPPTNVALVAVTVAICLIPLIVTAMSKAKASKPLTLTASLLGAIYIVTFWINH
ncbi:MAG: hypothetical protein AAF653_14885 [Chloroflexota bacterium]